jgi:hypothetical protein
MFLSVATTLAYYILVQASMVKSITESYCSALISICCYAAQEARSSTDFITDTGAFANDNSANSANVNSLTFRQKCDVKRQIRSSSNKTQLFSSLNFRLNKLECLSLTSFHASLTSVFHFRSLPEWSTVRLRPDTQILDWFEKNRQ